MKSLTKTQVNLNFADGLNLWFFKLQLYDLTEFISKIYDIGFQLVLGIGKSEFVTKTQILYINFKLIFDS